MFPRHAIDILKLAVGSCPQVIRPGKRHISGSPYLGATTLGVAMSRGLSTSKLPKCLPQPSLLPGLEVPISQGPRHSQRHRRPAHGAETCRLRMETWGFHYATCREQGHLRILIMILLHHRGFVLPLVLLLPPPSRSSRGCETSSKKTGSESVECVEFRLEALGFNTKSSSPHR